MDLNHYVLEKETMLICLASETCALDTIGAEFVRDVEPGEVVTIDERRILSQTNHFVLKPRRSGKMRI